ncbi:hypothetical protein C5167_047654 [Papaver somniferum]|uniref:Uncharacterized protein n=1 Tax=Papaver somniferum TaxID=3469 RepID=A0A4Y7LK63_PAPSO|nr:hypothetical protein C5167_047654 [Papaver somniferum]
MSEESDEMKLGLEHKPLIMNEIIQARELVKELQTTLDPTSSTPRKLLISKILSSFETSLSMIDRIDKDKEHSTMESPGHDRNVVIKSYQDGRKSYTFARKQRSKDPQMMLALGGNTDGKILFVLIKYPKKGSACAEESELEPGQHSANEQEHDQHNYQEQVKTLETFISFQNI